MNNPVLAHVNLDLCELISLKATVKIAHDRWESLGLEKSAAEMTDILAKLDEAEIQFYNDLEKASLESAKEDTHMLISFNNGRSYYDADEIRSIGLDKILSDEHVTWDYIATVMDDEIREQVHRELAPCSNEDFLIRYLELSPDNFIVC